MKTILFKTLLLVMLLPFFGFSTNYPKGKYEKSTTIKKEFKVDANALLKIKNRYGNVDIVSWSQNKITIEIVITVNGNSESAVEKRLGNIRVEFIASSSEVSVRTIIEKRSRNWSWWGNRKNVNYKINYTVKMPVTNNLNLSNDYGSISIDRLKGEANINCDYGRFDIGELLNENNKINADYVSASNIDFINGAYINSDYSKINIEKANDIVLNADYTTTQFENVAVLKYSCDYGSLKVNKAGSITGSGDYISLRVKELANILSVKADYGSIRIDKILKGFKTLSVSTDYTSGMKFGFEDGASFDFNVKLQYARFKYDDFDMDFNKKVVKSTSKYYEGFYGKQDSGSTVNINVEYGNVTFYKN